MHNYYGERLFILNYQLSIINCAPQSALGDGILSGTEDKDQAAREFGANGGENSADAINEPYGELRSHKEFSALRGELEAILSEIGVGSGSIEEVAEETVAKQPKAGRSRTLSVIANALFYLGIAVVVVGAVLFRFAGSDAPHSMFGYSAMIMLTGSMQSEIPKDSLVVTRRVDIGTIQLGDDITFHAQRGIIVTHRVIGIHEQFSETGARGFETKGIENARADAEIVPAANVIGRVVFHSESAGRVLLLIRQNLMLTTIACVIIIACFIVVHYLRRKKQ